MLKYTRLYKCTLSLLLAVTSSGGSRTVANDSHYWFLVHFSGSAFMPSHISWSSLLSTITWRMEFFSIWSLAGVELFHKNSVCSCTRRVWHTIKMMQLWRDHFKWCELMPSRCTVWHAVCNKTWNCIWSPRKLIRSPCELTWSAHELTRSLRKLTRWTSAWYRVRPLQVVVWFLVHPHIRFLIFLILSIIAW